MSGHRESHLCPVCGGEGIRRFNETRNYWGVWEADEEPCTACNGTGMVVREP